MEILFATVCFVFVLVCVLLLVIGFLSTLSRALRRVSPENRRMGPDQVWLNLIPFWNVVWASVTVDRVAASLHNEYVSRGLHRRGATYGQKYGFALLVLLPVDALIFRGLFTEEGIIVIFVLLFFAVTLCLWIAHWVQINNAIIGLKAGAYRPPVEDEW